MANISPKKQCAVGAGLDALVDARLGLVHALLDVLQGGLLSLDGLRLHGGPSTLKFGVFAVPLLPHPAPSPHL